MNRHMKLILLTVVAIMFMLPLVSTVAATESPPAITNNVNEITMVIAAPDATDLFNVDGIITDANFTKKAGDIPNQMNPAQYDEEAASIADYMKTNGTDMDGAIINTRRNTNQANVTETPSLIDNAIHSSVECNTFVENTTDITRSTGADAQQLSSGVAFVLKIEISAGANVYNFPAEYVMTHAPVDLSGLVAAELKIPNDLVANNTGTLTISFTVENDVQVVNGATIEYSIQAGQKVRTLTSEEQAATYRMTGDTNTTAEQIEVTLHRATIKYPIPLAGQSVGSRTIISTTCGITALDLVMINSAAAIHFTDITVTAMVQNEETAAYANDLVAAGFENKHLVYGIDADGIADTVKGRAPTTTHNNGVVAFDIAGAGLTLSAA